MAKNDAPKPDKAELFQAYREANAQVREAKEEAARRQQIENRVVSEIVKHYGPGPYKVDGSLVMARGIPEKDGGGHYFRSFDNAEEV